MAEHPYVPTVAFWERPFDPAETVTYEIDMNTELEPRSDTIASVAWSVSTEATAVNLQAVDAGTYPSTLAEATISFSSLPAVEDVHHKAFDVIADITTTNGEEIRKVRRLFINWTNSAESRSLTLVTLEEIKSWLNITEDRYNYSIADLQKRVAQYIEEQTDRTIVGQQSVVEVLNGNGYQDKLFLRNEPTDAFASYTVEIRDGLDGTWTVQTDDYEVQGRELLRLESVWPKGCYNIRVTYVAGWDDVPEKIKSLALEVIGKSWRDRQTITPAAVVGQESIIPLRVPTTAQAQLDALRTNPYQGIGR